MTGLLENADKQVRFLDTGFVKNPASFLFCTVLQISPKPCMSKSAQMVSLEILNRLQERHPPILTMMRIAIVFVDNAELKKSMAYYELLWYDIPKWNKDNTQLSITHAGGFKYGAADCFDYR